MTPTLKGRGYIGGNVGATGDGKVGATGDGQRHVATGF